MSDYNYMKFITGIHYTKASLKALNGMTFLFNPNWTVGASSKPTFPVCFFHVKSHHDVMESEISQKTALFYNDASSLSYSTLNGAMTNVVADNIVNKPKVYKLDVIIPYSDLSLLSTNYAMNTYTRSAIASFMAENAKSSDILSQFTSSYSVVTPYIEVLKTIISNLIHTSDITSASLYTDTNSLIESVTATPDYNKRSLEAMWASRGILKMKMWTGWEYKYVAITNMDISKEPTEEGVYEATLTLQEVPIMTIRRTEKSASSSYSNPVLQKAGETVISLLNDKEETTK